MKSLGTGYRADAVRKARIVAAAFEQEWRDIEIHGARPVIAAPSKQSKPAPPPTSPADKTLRQAFELFRTDPAKHRSRKTDLHYLNLIELTVGLWGENRTIRSIDREASRELLDVLLWLPANAEKKFPKLSPLAASRMAKEKGLTGRLSPASVNGYMCKFRAVMNFCQNEGWIERNPAKGLQVIDRVRRRDKRLPFSIEQLRLIFDAPVYRGCVDDWAGYSTPGYAHPRRGRFWVPLIALFSGMRMNEMLAVFSEFERALIRSRVIAGLERARAKGVQFGRPSLSPDRVARVEKALKDGQSIRAVAKATGTSTASVQRIKRSMLAVEEDRLESVAS
nr:recombinase family protein [Brevundimonas sp.]